MLLHPGLEFEYQAMQFLTNCTLYEVHASILGESDLLKNYVDYVRKAYKGSSTWCK